MTAHRLEPAVADGVHENPGAPRREQQHRLDFAGRDRGGGRRRKLTRGDCLVEGLGTDRKTGGTQLFSQRTAGLGAGRVKQRAVLRPGPLCYRLGQRRGIAIGTFRIGEPGGARGLRRLRTDRIDGQVAPRRAPGERANPIGAGDKDGLEPIQRDFGRRRSSGCRAAAQPPPHARAPATPRRFVPHPHEGG